MARAFSPLDDHLALLPGKLTPQLQGWLVRLGAWMPFQRAADLLADLTQVRVSRATARRLSEAAGATYVVQQTAEAAQLLEIGPPPPVPSARVVLSVDGAMVPLIGGVWAEAKTLALGEVQVAPAEGAPVGAISYFSRLADAETFGQQALSETHRRGVLAAPAVAAVTDGAEWIQGFVDLHCPGAQRILDFAHAAQRLGAVSQALWGAQDPEGARAWLAQQCHELKHAGPGGVIRELLRQQVAHPHHEELAEHLGYLSKRVGQMQYPIYQAAGWPIGSGMVESANKLVVEARLKGSGMHWQRANVNAMLALRNVVCSDRWAEGWAQMQAGRSAAVRRTARRARQAEAAQAAQVAKLRAAMPAPLGTRPPATPGGPPRPALNHPWRRAVRPHMVGRQPSEPHPPTL